MKEKPRLDSQELGNWTITQLPMDDIGNQFYRIVHSYHHHFTKVRFRYIHFSVRITGGHGFNIGRYDEKGSQRTMYVPSHILKQGINEVLVFESDRQQTAFDNNERNMTFMDHRLWTHY